MRVEKLFRKKKWVFNETMFCIYTLQLRGSEFSSTITSLGGTSLASGVAIGGRGKEAVGFFSDRERERERERGRGCFEREEFT